MRTSLADRVLPNYSRGEEIFNMVSHITGTALGIVALVLCEVALNNTGKSYAIPPCAIYGASMIVLYTISSIYHGLKHKTAKKVLQILDHCAIYILIAGTYTMLALGAIITVNPTIAWVIFGIEWGLAAVALTFTAIDLHKYRKLEMICYIIMGWLIVLFYGDAMRALTWGGFSLILWGGIFFTVGSVLYGVGKKKKYAHNVFHIFVLIGSFFHFLAILFYICR